MLGRRLGHFEIQSLIGEGGMGAVYKARDTHLDRDVALKVLPHDKMSDPDRKRRFTQEAKAASALNHPNIITIYDIASDEGVDYIAMEFVEGRTLDALLASGPLPFKDALKYARQMADALATAHGAGILHRDLKPANVMVRDNGLIKLLDFGLAKLTDAGNIGETSERDRTRTMGLTQTGTIMGTVAYMSPEQAEGKKLDFRSDIFSFGLILYEMFASKRAFSGDSQASLLASLLRDDPQPIPEIRSGVPEDLDRLIARTLRKDPALRVQSMADLKAALDDFAESTRTSTILKPPPLPQPGPVAAPPPIPPPPQAPAQDPSREERRTKRKRGLRVVFVLIMALWLIPAAYKFLRKIIIVDTTPDRVSTVDSGMIAASAFTTDPGVQRQPAFSPDGNSVVYSWNGPKADNFDIYSKARRGDPRRLTTDAAEDFEPVWSPDGDTIAFLRRHGDTDQILEIPAKGGAERKVAEIAHRDGNRLAWSKNSRALIFPDAPSAGAPAAIYELQLDTGAKRRLVRPANDGSSDLWPALSTNGSNLAFVRQLTAHIGEIYIAEMPDSDESDASADQVTSLGGPSTHPAWTETGKQIIFASGGDLWRVDADSGSTPQRLVGAGADSEDPALSRKNRRLIFDKKDAGLWIVDRFR